MFPVLCMCAVSHDAHSQHPGSHPAHSQLTSTGEQSVLRECFYLYPPSQDFVEFKPCQACAHHHTQTYFVVDDVCDFCATIATKYIYPIYLIYQLSVTTYYCICCNNKKLENKIAAHLSNH